MKHISKISPVLVKKAPCEGAAALPALLGDPGSRGTEPEPRCVLGTAPVTGCSAGM